MFSLNTTTVTMNKYVIETFYLNNNDRTWIINIVIRHISSYEVCYTIIFVV